MENCIFCKIINRQIPSYKVWEDENYLAFLTIMPINPGHVLVIPKSHTDYFYDLDDDKIGKLMMATKPVAQALKQAFEPKTGRIGVMVAGIGVPHVHIHLIPMNAEGDLTFARQKKASDKELEQAQKQITKEL